MTAKRVLISLDERLLARIDQACARSGMTRSAYLAQLAERDLEAGAGPLVTSDPELARRAATVANSIGDG